VFEFPWCDDFAAARNESIRHATKPWIFWLDADDVLDENQEKLEKLCAGLRDVVCGYMMECAAMTPGGVLQASGPLVRLFPNDPRVRWERRVHEQVIPSIQKCGGTIRATGIVVQHFGYATAQVLHAKAVRNLRLAELECVERSLDPYAQFRRGGSLADLGRSAIPFRTPPPTGELRAPGQPLDAWTRSVAAMAVVLQCFPCRHR
jgi:hypothetical protein